MTIIALDIDDTITAAPEFFVRLAMEVKRDGGEVHVVSSRGCESSTETIGELKSYGLVWDQLYLLPPISRAQVCCPHADLDWYEKYLWQKVGYALKAEVELFVDDDRRVLGLLSRYAPRIRAFHPDEQAAIAESLQSRFRQSSCSSPKVSAVQRKSSVRT